MEPPAFLTDLSGRTVGLKNYFFSHWDWTSPFGCWEQLPKSWFAQQLADSFINTIPPCTSPGVSWSLWPGALRVGENSTGSSNRSLWPGPAPPRLWHLQFRGQFYPRSAVLGFKGCQHHPEIQMLSLTAHPILFSSTWYFIPIELLGKGLISRGGVAWFGPTDSSVSSQIFPTLSHSSDPVQTDLVGTETRPGAQGRVLSCSGDPSLRLS